MSDSVQQEAFQILDSLAFTALEQSQHLTPESIERIVNSLPDFIKVALIEKSTELECPLEATIEMVISSFLDEESLSFEDCLLAKRLKDSGANHQ